MNLQRYKSDPMRGMYVLINKQWLKALTGLFLGIIVFSFNMNAAAQHLQIQVPPGLSDTMFSTYYRQRVSLFKTLPIQPAQVIFLGNSITDGGEWNELFADRPGIINRGISGDMTAGVLNRLDEITNRKPSKIFLLIGTNDLARGISTDSVLANIFLMARLIHQNSPNTRLYIQSIFPVNSYYHMFSGHTSNIDKIKAINATLAQNSGQLEYTYINVFDQLKGPDGLMNIHLTNDGLHLNGEGYMRWKHLIYPYIMDVTQKAALLPAPKSLQWKTGSFPLFQLRQIIYQQDSLRPLVAAFLHETHTLPAGVTLAQRQTRTQTQFKQADQPSLLIQCVPQLNQWPDSIAKIPTDARGREAYILQVTDQQITLSATNRHGIYNGLQTLKQLMRDGSFVDNCRIMDYPAFTWRGYMIDVGRNYQPMDLIKKQIDVMADLKMNVFHFHLTEDVAWRLAIQKYPQLTSAESMTRDQGLFYSRQNISELIRYCKDRFITFIPEIDMPGHSAAFKRAMGFDMQSDSGITVLKDILTEICDTYNLPYIHIGADEVHIRNKEFLPQIMGLLSARGVKTIGWEPGGDYTAAVYRQYWGGASVLKESVKKIDSRNLYVNHMAPEESVISIYNHQIDDQLTGDTLNIGGTLCLWNDRKLAHPIDNLQQNPTLAALLSFAEKSWCGGGLPGNLIGLNHLSLDQKESFAAFEDRLLAIQKTFYRELPFQYIRQSNIKWQLIGPFDNKGNLHEVFSPEQITLGNNTTITKNETAATITVTGATIILRHFWDPAARGFLQNPNENTTYYAKGQYWSPVDTTAMLWAGFYDYSRSTATAPPQPGTWNQLQSQIWLNGQVIAPPDWQRAGQKGDLEIPYTDENYYFHAPINVHLKKGMNQLLLKLPVGKFNSGIWYAPVKWMFTAVFVQPQTGSTAGNMEQNAALYWPRQ